MVVMFGGSLFTSTVFGHYGRSDTGIAAIMVPASRLEKFLNAILIVLLFIIPLTVFFVKFHYWSVEYANSRLPAGGRRYYPLPADVLRYFIYMHVMIQGAVLLGSIQGFKADSFSLKLQSFGVFLKENDFQCLTADISKGGELNTRWKNTFRNTDIILKDTSTFRANRWDNRQQDNPERGRRGRCEVYHFGGEIVNIDAFYIPFIHALIVSIPSR